jgi:hypothetical protein
VLRGFADRVIIEPPCRVGSSTNKDAGVHEPTTQRAPSFLAPGPPLGTRPVIPPASDATAATPEVPEALGGVMGHLTPLAAKVGMTEADVYGMVESWRWRATWGATLGAMGAVAAMHMFVYGYGSGHSSYSIGQSDVRWLVLIVFMVLGGMLGDLFGHRRLLIGSLSVVTACSMLASFYQSQPTMLASLRFVAAVFGAIALPLSLAVLRTSLKQQMLGIGVMVYMSGYCVGLALPHIGNLMGAWLGPQFTFVPVVLSAAVGLNAVSQYVPFDTPVVVHEGDLVAAALFILAVTGLVVGMQHAAAPDTRTVVSVAWIGMGLVSLGAFFWWQGRLPSAALDMGRFRQRWFLAALFSGAVVSFGLQLSWRAALLMLLGLIGSVTLHQVLILTLMAAVGAGVGMAMSAVFSSRVNGGHLMASGIAAMGVGLLGVAAVFHFDTPVMWLSVPVALVGGGIVLGNLLRTLVIVAGVPARSVGTAVGLLNAVGYLGGLMAPLVLRAVLRADLTSMGVSVDQVKQAVSIVLDQGFTAAVNAIMGGSSTPTGSLFATFQQTLQYDLIVLSTLTGLAILAAAAIVWVAWRGHDTPLWPPRGSDGPVVLGERAAGASVATAR